MCKACNFNSFSLTLSFLFVWLWSTNSVYAFSNVGISSRGICGNVKKIGARKSFLGRNIVRNASEGGNYDDSFNLQKEELFEFDPFNFESVYKNGQLQENNKLVSRSYASIDNGKDNDSTAGLTALATILSFGQIDPAFASELSSVSRGDFNPANFQPVCPASDGFYRVIQGSVEGVVGRENFVEYGPLIASGLLRIRLELCVVESFFSEAVVPFIKKNGLSWVLPFHETVETFLAGTVFALALTFILVGSSKILVVIAFYTDFFLGAPSRALGGFANDRALGKPVTLDIGIGPFKTRAFGPPDEKDENGNVIEKKYNIDDASTANLAIVVVSAAVKIFGQISGFIREAFEALDLFVGRYLVLWASAYIALKFIHFKIFPDFP